MKPGLLTTPPRARQKLRAPHGARRSAQSPAPGGPVTTWLSEHLLAVPAAQRLGQVTRSVEGLSFPSPRRKQPCLPPTGRPPGCAEHTGCSAAPGPGRQPHLSTCRRRGGRQRLSPASTSRSPLPPKIRVRPLTGISVMRGMRGMNNRSSANSPGACPHSGVARCSREEGPPAARGPRSGRADRGTAPGPNREGF